MASKVMEMKADEIEHYIELVRDYMNDTQATRERVEELNNIFPSWVLANWVQMNKLRELGFSREDYYALRHKIAADQRHHTRH